MSHTCEKPFLSYWGQSTLAPRHTTQLPVEWWSEPAEVFAQDIATPRALDGHAPLGLVGHPHHPQGGPEMYDCRPCTGLRLPGEFFSPQAIANVDLASYITQLKGTMRALRYTPTRQLLHSSRHLDNFLRSATHVFVRHDAVRKPLQPSV